MKRLLLILLLIYTFAVPVISQENDKIISALTAENLELKKQLEALKQENDILKAEITKLKNLQSTKDGVWSTVKGIAIPEPKTIELPNQIKLDVAHISQQNDNKSCATTSVTMAISYYEGKDKSPLDKEKVWEISGTNEDIIRVYGNDMTGLERIAKYYGYRSEYAELLTFHDLEFLLSRGVLVVLNIKYRKTGSATHAVLVTGYDRSKKIFYVNDPAEFSAGSEILYSDLNARWSAYLSSPLGMSIRSGFIIYPKTEIKQKN